MRRENSKKVEGQEVFTKSKRTKQSLSQELSNPFLNPQGIDPPKKAIS